MDYTVLHIAVSDDEQAEILTAELADFPFESFETEGGLLKAYIPAVRLSGCKTDVDALLARRGVEGRYAVIPTQNWNASWESDFPPVDVEGRLRIRAPFHDPAPAGEMEAVVLPRMSFGTGHHATTWLMSRAVLGSELRAARDSTWAAARACWRSSPPNAARRTSTLWTSTTGRTKTAVKMSPRTVSRTGSNRCWAT